MIKKLLLWLVSFLPSLLGIAEAAVKFIKEVLTLVVDILFPIIPIAKFKVLVTTIRGGVDKLYDWISKNKEKLLAYLKLI